MYIFSNNIVGVSNVVPVLTAVLSVALIMYVTVKANKAQRLVS